MELLNNGTHKKTFLKNYFVVSAETSNCNEKVKDSEEYSKKEIEKLKKSIDENEKFFRKELWQLREQTGA